MLDGGTRDYLVPLSFVAEKEGMQKFTAVVSSLPGELTPQNNRHEFLHQGSEKQAARGTDRRFAEPGCGIHPACYGKR